jgi:Uncharacterized ACR, COG1430
MSFLQRFAFASMILALFAVPGIAQVASVVFTREIIRIDAATDEKTPPAHAPLKYDTEVRGEDALKLEYIHTLNTLNDGTAVMIRFNASTMVALPPLQVHTPVDALFVNDSGAVVQILPNITLASITSSIAAREPVKAFVFLKAGEVAARGIRPRDTVAGSMFSPGPAVMQ